MTEYYSRYFKPSAFVVASFLFGAAALGQTVNKRERNNPFSPSPRSIAKNVKQQSESVSYEPEARIVKTKDKVLFAQSISNDQLTFGAATSPENTSLAPTSVYRVGIGDVLGIEIQNAETASGNYAVRADGTIDFPLAGERVHISGQTTEEIGEALSVAVTLFQTPQITVKIREYVSHGVLVKGLVDVPGFHQIQRDAVPLYVIRAAAIISPLALGVKIDRIIGGAAESYLLISPNVDAVLVYPGDTVEFTASPDNSTIGYYFIGGNIAAGGKKDLIAGTTLSQALAASGGTTGNSNRALLRRRNEFGTIITIGFEIKSLKSGKISDPRLTQGDIIEIVK